jgi:hypothetical protein
MRYLLLIYTPEQLDSEMDAAARPPSRGTTFTQTSGRAASSRPARRSTRRRARRPSASATARPSRPTARSPRRRRPSAASTCQGEGPRRGDRARRADPGGRARLDRGPADLRLLRRDGRRLARRRATGSQA